MSMAERIRRVERILALLESEGRGQEATELRRLFNEYAGEIRHLEARAALSVVLKANNEVIARNTTLYENLEPFTKELKELEVKRTDALVKTEAVKIALLSRVNAAHILVTLVLAFGFLYALFGFPLPRVVDVVSIP